jgi:hypothetical protein
MLEPINPFCLPDSPGKLLCPWMYPSHRELYVDLDNSKQAFEEFVHAMGSPTTLSDYGRLALVTGDSGCGKSALVHRCVDWVVEELKRNGLPSMPVDLTRVLHGRPQMEIEKRLSRACDSLFTRLLKQHVLKTEDAEYLRPDRDDPDRVYPLIPEALVDNRVLIVLLPSPGDLVNEVIRYAALVEPRMLFVVESALFEERNVYEIRNSPGALIQPITMSVGELQPGDAKAFIKDRLTRHSDRGIYPGMTEETMEAVARLLQSVAQLQRALSGTYGTLLHSGQRYDKNSFVTVDDVRQEIRRWLGGGP